MTSPKQSAAATYREADHAAVPARRAGMRAPAWPCRCRVGQQWLAVAAAARTARAGGSVRRRMWSQRTQDGSQQGVPPRLPDGGNGHRVEVAVALRLGQHDPVAAETGAEQGARFALRGGQSGGAQVVRGRIADAVVREVGGVGGHGVSPVDRRDVQRMGINVRAITEKRKQYLLGTNPEVAE